LETVAGPSKLANVNAPFPRVTYDEAIQILSASAAIRQWGDDFGGDEETILSSAYDRPLMVHRYPAAIKAFYMQPDPTRRPGPGFLTCSLPKATAKSSRGERVADYEFAPRAPAARTICRKRPLAVSRPSQYGGVPHAASVWAWNARWHGFAELSTSVK